MKKLFSLLTGCLLLLGSSPAATVTISNYTNDYTGMHGIAGNNGALIASEPAAGIMGRMTISDPEIALKVSANDIAGLSAAFQPFDPVNGTFALNSFGSGAFESSESFDTRASVNSFGGSPIYVWLYKGASRTNATEFLLVKLNSTFPTDPEIEPPTGPIAFNVNINNVATLFAGTSGPGTHDFGLGGGALPVYAMASIAPGGANFAPVASGATVDVVPGVPFQGNLSATDADDDALTYSLVTQPGKATNLFLNGNTGAFTYTANPAFAESQDTFTFKANDGAADSNTATITVNIGAIPPNDPPVAESQTFDANPGQLLTAQLSASDGDGNPLTFAKVGNPASGTVTVDADGTFRYLPNAGFTGSDSFTFKANDGFVDSNIATATVLVTLAVPQWTWLDGSSLTKQKGLYGDIGEPAANNHPGARSDAASASTGALTYLFGGLGFGETAGPGELNDLWMYNAESGFWTWLGGGKGIKTQGTYGTLGTAAPGNVPGGRSGGHLWVEGTNVWLFGGTGRDSTAAGNGILNDLWVFDLMTSEWTWVAGANTINANGTYGTRGAPAAGNTPGARKGGVAWTGPDGDLWLFGGNGRPATGVKAGSLNDLWRFDDDLGQWTWMHGDNTLDAAGVYGSLGAGSASTKPGARANALGWVNSEATLWLFGGSGRAIATAQGYLNDLWKYEVLTNQWTWVKGGTVTNAPAVYGTQGTPAAANTPGGRAGSIGWRIGDGTLVFFGGQGSTGHYNDVWAFDTEANAWAWAKGPAVPNGAALYGGTTPPQSSGSTTPGARRGAVALAGATEDLLLFGGTNAANNNNDVWELDIPGGPLPSIISIVNITDTTAGVFAKVDPNGADTQAKLLVMKVTDLENPDEVDLGLLTAAGGAQVFNETLESLEPGTTYAVVVQAESAAGDTESLVQLFTTTGTSSATVTVAFAENATFVNEDDGSVQIEVTLTAPATVAFDLPFTITGTAQAADFTAPAVTNLSFVPGQFAASIGIGITNDAVANENPETVIVTLGTPTGGIGFTPGGFVVHTVTIQDADVLPVASGGAPQFVRTGSFARMAVGVLSPTPVGYQWKKNGVNIVGATAATYIIPVVAKADAATYSVVVTNASGSDTETFELFVFDYIDKIVVLPAAGNSTFNFTSAVSSPKSLTPTYLWYQDDVAEAPAVTTAGYKRTGLNATDGGEYVCKASFGSAMDVVVSRYYLGVTTEAPVIAAAIPLPPGNVGAVYEYDVPITNLPDGAPTSFTATGLVAGLKISSTGKISGIPTALATNKPVVITAKNGSGASNVVNTTLSILPLPSAAVGSFVGIIGRSAITGTGGGGGLGARFEVTVTTGGKYTAKLVMGAAAALSSTGQLYVNSEDEEATGEAVFVRKPLPSLKLAFAISTATPAPAVQLTGVLEEPATGEQAAFVTNNGLFSGGYRKVATATVASYNFGLAIPSQFAGAFEIPQGKGFGNCAVSGSGVTTFAGRTADGATFTCGSILGPKMEVPFYSGFTAALPGSLLGVPFVDDGNFEGVLNWQKNPVDAKSKERAYRAGFAAMDLDVFGGQYTPPAANTPVMGLPNVSSNAVLILARTSGGVLASDPNSFVFSLLGKGPVLPNPNPNKLAFKLDAKPLGQFGGSVNLLNPVPALTRPVNFYGIIIPPEVVVTAPPEEPGAPVSTHTTAGFYLAPAPPEPGQTVATSPLISGEASVQPNN